MAKKKIGVIYGRKSRENATTLEGQIAACKDWAIREGIEIENIYIEEGDASSEDYNRPKLQEMIKHIENQEYHLVIVSEQTRISRTEDFGQFKKLMRETETLFVCADTNTVYDFNNREDAVRSGINQVFGEYELSTAKIRLKRGTVQSAKKGNYQGKKPPIGYDYDKNTKRLIKNQDAPVIKRMFELYAEGKSTVEIENIFNNIENAIAYHKVKGEKVLVTWGKSTIARALKNVHYTGDTLFGKTKTKKVKGKKQKIATDEDQQILVKDTHEAIVSKELFQAVQDLMKKRNTQPPALKKVKHVFSGLIACANCGKIHTFEQQCDQYREWRISSCTTRVYNEDFTKHEMCGNSGCKLHFVEKMIFSTLEKIKLDIEKYINLVQDNVISNEGLQKSKDAQKNAKMLQIQNLKKKRKKIQQLIEDDFYDAEEEIEKMQELKMMKKDMAALEKEIEQMNIIEEESETKQLERVLNNIKRFLEGKDTITEIEQNEILSEFIYRIVYRKAGKNAKIEIEIHMKDNIKEIFNETILANKAS